MHEEAVQVEHHQLLRSIFRRASSRRGIDEGCTAPRASFASFARACAATKGARSHRRAPASRKTRRKQVLASKRESWGSKGIHRPEVFPFRREATRFEPQNAVRRDVSRRGYPWSRRKSESSDHVTRCEPMGSMVRVHRGKTCERRRRGRRRRSSVDIKHNQIGGNLLPLWVVYGAMSGRNKPTPSHLPRAQLLHVNPFVASQRDGGNERTRSRNQPIFRSIDLHEGRSALNVSA